MFSLTEFQNHYDPCQTEVVIKGRAYTLFLPKSIEPFIDSREPLKDFPLWAKVWNASVVLADTLARMPAEPSQQFLEIGSGIGLTGVVAAACGHCITVTDYNSDALQFARANAEINGCSTMSVMALDWLQPSLDRRFDYIIGADIVYKEKDILPMQRLFEKVLKPKGKILLVEQMRETVLKFHAAMSGAYRIVVERKTLRNDEETTRLVALHLTLKPT